MFYEVSLLIQDGRQNVDVDFQGNLPEILARLEAKNVFTGVAKGIHAHFSSLPSHTRNYVHARSRFFSFHFLLFWFCRIVFTAR